MVLPSVVWDRALCPCKRNQLYGLKDMGVGFILW